MGARSGDQMADGAVEWLGLDQPLAVAARIILAAAAPQDDAVDLSDVTVVVPGGRARRQLLRALVHEAATPRLTPPRVLLPHEVEQALFDAAPVAIADETTTRLAWLRALRVADPGLRAALLPPSLGAGLVAELRSVSRLQAVAAELESACVELTALPLAAAERGADPTRYDALRQLAVDARSILAAQGLRDADLARREAAEAAPRAGGPVFLFATVDLSARARRSLARVADRLRPLCIADPADRDRFDRLGCVVPQAWRGAPQVPLAAIRVADRPIDQAIAVVDWLGEIAVDGCLDPDRIAIVLADDGLADAVGRELAAAGAPAHDARGLAVAQLEPAVVLQRYAAFLRRPSTWTLREFWATPAVDRALRLRAGLDAERDSAVAALDHWRAAQHDRPLDPALPFELGWAPDASGRDGDARRVLDACDRAMRNWHARLPANARLGEFAAPLLALLGECFAAAAADDDRGAIDAAIAALRAQFAALRAAPAALQPDGGAADAIDVVLALCAAGRAHETPRADELDVIGWLDLPFDPAADLVVAGMNEGRVPASRVDPWLPDLLRRDLGLPDEARRAARDSWVLSTAVARSARFIVGRRDASGEPLAPSRLLLTGSGRALAERVLELSTTPPPRPPRGGKGGAFPPPDPVGPFELERIAVTAFKAYLTSGYQFWIERVQRLRAARAAGDELDPAALGQVVHAVLEAVVRPAGERGDPGFLRRALHDELARQLTARAGAERGAPLQIQQRILETRFDWFAAAQADEHARGWRVIACEHSISGVLEIPDGPAIELVGKVDRIDYHEADQRWRILDYKTGDRTQLPDPAHRQRDGTWRDLQLPLYHYLLADALQARAPGTVEAGYFVLGCTAAQVGVRLATEVVAARDAALDEARTIVQAIRCGALPLGEPSKHDDAIALVTRSFALPDDEQDGSESEA